MYLTAWNSTERYNVLLIVLARVVENLKAKIKQITPKQQKSKSGVFRLRLLPKQRCCFLMQ
jgi:hypothetical protein